MNSKFVGYQAVSKYNLQSADCLCYKWFPSIQDIMFNHRQTAVYALSGFLRIGLNDPLHEHIEIPFRLL